MMHRFYTYAQITLFLAVGLLMAGCGDGRDADVPEADVHDASDVFEDSEDIQGDVTEDDGSDSSVDSRDIVEVSEVDGDDQPDASDVEGDAVVDADAQPDASDGHGTDGEDVEGDSGSSDGGGDGDDNGGGSTPAPLDGCVQTTRVDEEGDGNIEQIYETTFSDDGFVACSKQIDPATEYVTNLSVYNENNKIVLIERRNADDGALTSRTSSEYEGELLVRRESDYDGDGVNESVTEYEYDERGREVLMKRDSDGDGTFERFEEELEASFYENGKVSSKLVRRTYNTDVISSETLVRYRYEYHSSGELMREERDEGDDGFVEDVEIWEFDDEGREVLNEEYEDDEQTLSRGTYISFLDEGRTTKRETDYDGDGVIDIVNTTVKDEDGQLLELTYRDIDNADSSYKMSFMYDVEGATRRTETDRRIDGTIDEYDESTDEFYDNNRLKRRSVDTEEPGDPNRVSTYQYDCE